MSKKILIIDDDPEICLLLGSFLSRYGYDTDTATSANKGIAKFKQFRFDAVLCDYRLGDKNGKDVLMEVKAHDPTALVLLMTGYADVKTAVDVIKSGAYDYITKPLIPDEILRILDNALNNKPELEKFAQHQGVNNEQKEEELFVPGVNIMISDSSSTKELYDQVKLVAVTNYSVILYGESGTGKEVIARTIHECSNRNSGPFVAMDCGTISNELSGSELFGHVKGSFTGAVGDKVGHFELANKGTLFLDEIANLSIDVQAALLRVIQERKLKRVGGVNEIDIDVRVIVASNENLQDAYRNGRFREDLFHRFNEFSINLPPLRKRKEDIEPFAFFFLSKINHELGKNVTGFDEEVMSLFHTYEWPGNLREFKNAIRRAVLLADGNKIIRENLPSEINGTDHKFQEEKNAFIQQPTLLPENFKLKKASAAAEYNAIIATLEKVNHNKTKAAEILNIDRKTLYNKIKAYHNFK